MADDPLAGVYEVNIGRLELEKCENGWIVSINRERTTDGKTWTPYCEKHVARTRKELLALVSQLCETPRRTERVVL